MDSDGSYHSESESYYPDGMTKKKMIIKKTYIYIYIYIYIAATVNEENQQNLDVFTLETKI